MWPRTMTSMRLSGVVTTRLAVLLDARRSLIPLKHSRENARPADLNTQHRPGWFPAAIMPVSCIRQSGLS